MENLEKEFEEVWGEAGWLKERDAMEKILSWCKLKISKAQQQVSVEPEVMRFAKPTINDDEFNKWLNDQRFYSGSEGVPIDKYILESYLNTVDQFIKSPESKATKSVFEIATQTIKKYLEQNV